MPLQIFAIWSICYLLGFVVVFVVVVVVVVVVVNCPSKPYAGLRQEKLLASKLLSPSIPERCDEWFDSGYALEVPFISLESDSVVELIGGPVTASCAPDLSKDSHVDPYGLSRMPSDMQLASWMIDNRESFLNRSLIKGSFAVKLWSLFLCMMCKKQYFYRFYRSIDSIVFHV